MGRFLLIGLDGAEPDLVQPWMDAGLLPNLARLRARGAFLPCDSVIPPATFPAWTTCVTGVNPGRHGIVDFTAMKPGEYGIRFVNSTFRRVPALWNTLSDAGRRVGVLGVPATYPPEPVNGFMVSGFDSPVATGVDASFVYPAELFDEVKEWRFADFQESRIDEGWHAMALEKLMAKIADKERITLHMLKKEPWDFFMVVFGESDTVAHHFWLFHDPDSPRFRPGIEKAIQQVYIRLDETVGRLMDAAGDDMTVGVVSDHGFGGSGTGVVHLNNWLEDKGLLTFSKGGDSLMKKAALKFTPQQWRGALFRRFSGLASRAESRSRFAGIDWSKTRAWSEELNYFPSIRINLAGREPRGVVAPEDYDQVVDELCTALESWAPIARAHRRDAIYDGPYADRAPDIIVEFALENGYSHSCLRSRGGPPFRRLEPHEFLGGKEKGMTGNHRPTGVLFLSKPCPTGWTRLEDIAPTILGELGVEGPPMDGTSLLRDMIESGTISGVQEQQEYSTGEEAVIEKRLRDLGYFE